jgi:hypothetical protein
MAANDLSLNVSLIRQYGEQGEGLYFFRLSFSHLREIAKRINEAQKIQPIQCFIQTLNTETQDIYRNISTSLAYFDDGSLTKDTLKPIRDECFHYPDMNSNNNPKDFKDLTKVLIALDKKEVRFLGNEESNLGQRYLFADAIAGYTVNSRLNKDIVDQISRIAFSIIQFVDHVLAFLKDKGPKCVT